MSIDMVIGSYASTTSATLESSTKSQEASGASSSDSGDETSSQGDSVEISEEGRTLAMKMGELKETEDTETEEGAASTIGSDDDEDDESSASDSAIQRIKSQITELQQQLQDAQSDGTLTEEQKQAKILQINQQIMQLNQELADLTGTSGSGSITGTSAEGMGNSLT